MHSEFVGFPFKKLVVEQASHVGVSSESADLEHTLFPS